MDRQDYLNLQESYQQVYQQEDDLFEEVVGYLLDEGYVDDVDSALALIEELSDEEIEGILEAKVVMSVTSPAGKQRRLNTTKATGPARNLDTPDRHNAFRDARSQSRGRQAISFTPTAERNAKMRSQDPISRSRQGDVNMGAEYITRRLQRKYGIPDSALDPNENSRGISNRAADLR